MARQPARKTVEDDIKQDAAQAKQAASDAAESGAEAAEMAYEELRDQFEALREDFANLSESLLRAGKQSASEATDAARRTGRKAAATVGENAEYATDQLETVLEDAENFARQRPAVTMGIAACAGFLLAMVMTRR